MQYSVSAERPRGRFGLFTRKTNLGHITEEESVNFGVGSNAVELSLTRGTLVIKSGGVDPVRVEFGAEPFNRRPKVVEVLSPDNPLIRTGRSLVTIIPLNGETRSRLVLRTPEQLPLMLTAGEVKAMEMGIDSMRGNVGAAARTAAIAGFVKGLDKGYELGFNKGHTKGD